MKQYSIWNTIDAINGVAASHFLGQAPFNQYNGDIILIYGEDGTVSNVECKEILAMVYGIDVNLPIDEFMAEYFAKTEEKEVSNAEVVA